MSPVTSLRRTAAATAAWACRPPAPGETPAGRYLSLLLVPAVAAWYLVCPRAAVRVLSARAGRVAGERMRR